MKSIALGNGAYLDLQKLLDTRGLIQAGSGGGKSYRIRWLCEQSYGQVQQIIIDMEGEFHTLREKFDYVLIGKDGDVNVEVRGAELLARRLLELNVSAIIDLYELKQHERIRFVKLFFDAMINAPKNLWHPVLVIVDECHVFCPQQGEAESSGSIIDLATRGRKRGYGCVLATQRLSKLHKDAAAECLNKMIGRTGLDIDRKRAGEELGYTTKEEMRSLRELEPGEMEVFGPAISNEVVKIPPCKVKTTHPKAGTRQRVGSTAPTSKVKRVLEELADLPQQAEEELRTKRDYELRIRELKSQLRQQKPVEKVKVEKVFDEREFERRSRQMRHDFKKEVDKLRHAVVQEVNGSQKTMHKALEAIKGVTIGMPIKLDRMEFGGDLKLLRPIAPTPKIAVPRAPSPKPLMADDTWEQNDNNGKLPSAALKMLQAAAAYYPEHITRTQMGAIAGYSYKSGHFSNMLTTLRSLGYVTENERGITCTEEGKEMAGDIEQIPTDPETLLRYWQGKLGAAAAKMLQAVYDTPDLTREDLGTTSGYSHTSGHFSNTLGKLRKNGLIREVDGRINLTEVFRQ